MSDDREPDAYGLLDEGEVWYATPFRIEAERVLARIGDTDSAIVSLYRSLTDAEREAVEQAIDAANGMIFAEPWAIQTLRALLERME